MISLIAIIGYILDRITKIFATNYLKTKHVIYIADELVYFKYAENKGAAFSILQNKIVFFITLTILLLAFVIYWIYNNHHQLNIFEKIIIGTLLGGILGNFYDRVKYGYVIDFIGVKLFRSYYFPLFNIADVLIVISSIMIAFSIIKKDGRI